MRYVEKVAKTVDSAVTEALIELGATTDQVEIEVIDKGSKGIFGFGFRNAKVKVTVKEKELEEQLELEKISDSIDLKSVLSKEDPKEVVEKEVNQQIETKVKPDKQQDQSQEENQEPDKESNKQESPSVARVERFLLSMLKEMGIEASLHTKIQKDRVRIEIEAEQASKIIGKRGDTLDSLQYLCNIVGNKDQEGYLKITLDTANYRQKREATLKKLAHKLAKKASVTKRPVTLEPMNPYDRRIIHAALQHNKYVKTHSEGKEPYRKVVISPYYTSKNTNK